MALEKEQPATLTSLHPIVSTSYTNYPLLLHKLLFKLGEPLNTNHHKHILRNPNCLPPGHQAPKLKLSLITST